MSKLILHLFGSPRIEVNGAAAEVDTRKATALMAYLAVTGGTHQRDSLAALLWPDYDQTSARAALRRTLSTLNRALEGENRESDGAGGTLEITRETIGLSPKADFWLDVREFHRLLGSLAAHPHSAQEVCPACLQTLEEAARLYHEPFMAGFNLRDSPNFEEWQFFQEETLRRELALALEKLALGLEASGAAEEAIQHARRWLALDPLLEEAHRRLMLLYNHAGQRNAALRQYRECVRILDQELGVAPLEETTRVYQAILNREELPEGEGRLRFVQPSEAKKPAARATPATIDDAPASSAAAEAPMPTAPPSAPTRPLVGRARELEQLQQAYASARGDGRLAALEGEAGIGKTRLSEAFLTWARERGARVIQARCYSGETGLAYAPLIEGLSSALALPEADARLRALPAGILSEAGRMLPGLSQPAAGRDTSPSLTADDGAQSRFFEALRQVVQVLLAGPVPGVLFLDDLHWADSATLDLLAYLARRLSGMHVLVLAAWRSEPGETVQALERLAGELARSGRADRLHLKRLGPAEIEALVLAFPGTSAAGTAALSARLYRESEGLPFVAVEYLAALSAQKFPQNWEIPASVRDLLRSRLAGLDSAAQQLLSTAAVIGRSFDFSTLHEASGRSEFETIDGLDQLLSTGLIVEARGNAAGGQAARGSDSEIQYDFTHEKLRALIYEETSLARRRLLHRRTADSLARSAGGRAEHAGLVAYHYEQGGLDAAAADFHRIAGERARQLFANVEAIAHFEAALAAGHADAAGLHEAIGDLRTLRGEYSAALTSYHAAASLCTPGCLGNLEHKLGNVHQRLGEWELAESHYQASLENAGEPEGTPSPFHVHLFADRSMVAHALGDLDKAQALADRALELAQVTAGAHDLAQAYNALGVLARARGDQASAIHALEASLRAAETLDDPLARIAALNNLALVYGEAGSLEEAIRLASQALELCQRRGDRHHEAALHNNLADLLHRCGREEEAMQQLKQAVVIFAEIGATDEDSASPARSAEVWKLTEW